jgi:hypothetical protein
MTRDEAAKIYCATLHIEEQTPMSELVYDVIDTYAALGMLKLDRPKDPCDLLSDELLLSCLPLADHLSELFDAMHRAGLKLVPK